MTHPTSSELNKKTWYRAFKIIGVLIIVATFIGPWVTHEPNPLLLLDGIVNMAIWSLILLLVRSVILYVAYGKKQRTAEEKQRLKEWAIWGPAIFLLVAGFLGLVSYLLYNL